ncbi:MAG: hypothetical protein HKN15_08390, partial [Xanthomonadales bacterium]|nr:hypothetical protein [Xanthomonadales bacterium]
MSAKIFSVLCSLMLFHTTAAARVVISNVDVLTMASATLLRDRVVIVEDGTISEVIDRRDFEPLSDDQLIDGQGGVLMPGLVDSHVHIDHPQDLRMMALYGVTSAINMRGLPWHLELRNTIRSESIFAPDFITGGDYLDGSPPDMLPMASVADEAAARRSVQTWKAAGYDFIKIYSELSAAQYRAICDEARKLQIAVIGHLLDDASLDDVLTCPQYNIAHGEQLFKLLESRTDPVEIRALLKALSEQNITLTTNRQLYREMGRQPAELDQLLARPESAVIHPATFQPWRPGINRYARRDDAWAGRVQQVYEDLAQINRIAQDVDPGMLVAGSDMPVAGSYPGVSLIDEIEAFHESGLDAYQALATATRNAAKLVATLSPDYPKVGVIQCGARADLLLLESNPAENLGKLRTPRGVMLRGRWYPADDLAAIRSKM